MPLVLALKNHDSVVVASDIDAPGASAMQYGQLMQLPGRTVLLTAGNLDAVRSLVLNTVLPKFTEQIGPAGLAQLLHAALVLGLAPNLEQMKGRVEFIVAGIDPVRHVHQPGLYYLDSAQNFNLMVVKGDAVAAGSVAAVGSLLAGRDFSQIDTPELEALAKECFSGTKLRWPGAVGAHIRLGTVTTDHLRFQDF
jgi:hypothetical protein